MHIKINNTLIDNVEDPDIVMSMYNLLEYSSNYPMKSESLWNYYMHEVIDDVNDDAGNYWITYSKATTSTSFGCKTKIIGSTPTDNDRFYTYVVSLKYVSNFSRSLRLP